MCLQIGLVLLGVGHGLMQCHSRCLDCCVRSHAAIRIIRQQVFLLRPCCYKIHRYRHDTNSCTGHTRTTEQADGSRHSTVPWPLHVWLHVLYWHHSHSRSQSPFMVLPAVTWHNGWLHRALSEATTLHVAVTCMIIVLTSIKCLHNEGISADMKGHGSQQHACSISSMQREHSQRDNRRPHAGHDTPVERDVVVSDEGQI
jgi:hypothetical protein